MRRGFALVLLLGALRSPAAAGSYLYIAGAPDDAMLDGRQVMIGAGADFRPAARTFPSGVLIAAATQDEGWTVLMEGSAAGAFGPGTYANASGPLVGTASYPVGRSHLHVSGPTACAGASEYGTPTSTGSFVVRHVLIVGSYLVELVADFEQRCAGATGSIRGTIVFEGGSLSCFNRPGGTPCDDRDPCTQDDVCQGGICAGVDTVTPTCTAPDACHDAGVCDRQLARCIGPQRADGSSCDDGSTCTTEDTCTDGLCTGAPLACDDASICTTDRCDPATGCRHEPAPGSCWVFRPVARTVATGTGPGGTARCSLRCQSSAPVTLLLGDDASYRVQGGIATGCDSGHPVVFPDEVGRTRPGRRGRLFLEPSNREEIAEANRRCSGTSVRERGYRQWVRPDGDRLEGRTTLRARTRVSGVPVSLVLNQRFTAVPALAADGSTVFPPPTDAEAATCSDTLRPRCTRE